jgi:hypothetical protein
MQEEYKHQKKTVGIDLDYFDIPEDNTSDVVFQALHPNINRSFKDIMSHQKIYESMKSTLIDPN